MERIRKLARVGRECVACGQCAAVCPRGAIRVWRGVAARVEAGLCVGCGLCAAACPAAVITLEKSGEET